MARGRHRDARRRAALARAGGGPASDAADSNSATAASASAGRPGAPSSGTLIDLPPERGIPRDDVAPLLAAHLAPVAAMIFLGQSGREILFLLAADTALAICVLAWLVIEHVTERNSSTTGVARALSHAGAALVVGAFMALLLVGPVALVALGGGGDIDTLIASNGFRTALVMQVVGSLWALLRMHRALSARDDDDAYLATRFKFVVARWFIVLFAVFSGIPWFFGPSVGAALVVLVYCGAGIWFGLSPERTHRLFHSGKTQSARRASSGG